MSSGIRCDICDGSGTIFHIRKRWRIFERFCYMGACIDYTMDFCDKCFEDFRKYAKEKSRKGTRQ